MYLYDHAAVWKKSSPEGISGEKGAIPQSRAREARPFQKILFWSKAESKKCGGRTGEGMKQKIISSVLRRGGMETIDLP